MSAIIPAATNRSLAGTIGGVIGGIIGGIQGGFGGIAGGIQQGAQIGNAAGQAFGGQTPPAGNTGAAAAGGSGQTPPGSSGYTGGSSGQPGTGVTTTGCGCKSSCKGDMCSATYGCGSRLNKHWLAPTKGGCGRVAHGWQAPGTWCVRRRRMNPLNVKALRRAERRAHSFLRITKHIVKHYTAKQPKGRAYISARRRRK